MEETIKCFRSCVHIRFGMSTNYFIDINSFHNYIFSLLNLNFKQMFKIKKQQVFTSVTLCRGLEKNGAIRPIAVNIFRRLLSKIVCRVVVNETGHEL